jgi:MscS family membrane protein
MYKIALFIILLCSSLYSEEILDDFIDKQIVIESKFLDKNISAEIKKELKEKQEIEYRDFLLRYTSNKNIYLNNIDPYRYKISKLKIRLRKNKYLGYTNAAFRDEVLLQSYSIKESIRNILHKIIKETDNSSSKNIFANRVDEVILEYFSKYKPFNKDKYLSSDLNLSSSIAKSLVKAININTHLESVANTFGSELINNSTSIYNTNKFSESKLFKFVDTINNSEYGKNINPYLKKIHLDLAKVILILITIIFIQFMQIVVKYTINHILSRYKLKDDDRDYIHTHITNLFNIVTTLFIFNIIFVVYLGIDSKSINISKIFGMLYVVLISMILYRVTNTIAYLKLDRMKSSKLLKNEVINLAIKAINSIIIIIAIIITLKILGVDLTTLLSGLGIAGAAVAFAAKDSIANIFGSISILLGNIFEQGDWIETKDVDGTVVEIGLRASTVRTFDNALISIPNFELANTGVKNWSRRSIGRRIKLSIGVTYESDFDDIKNAIEDIRVMLKNHPDIANEHTSFTNPDRKARLVSMEDFKGIKRTTLVYLDEFRDSSINILVYCFSRSVVWHEWLETKEDIMYKIAKILENNNLSFAYPTLMVHTDRDEI